MKEISIEQKDKACDGNYRAYTELINRLENVKCAIKEQNYGIAMDVLCKPYPEFQVITHSELKESGDEKIRRNIIAALKGEGYYDCDLTNECIAWLEKQGEQKPTLPKWKYKNDNTPLLRDSLILNKYGCVAQSPSGALVSDVWVIDYDELAKLPKEEIEKQGEQKPKDRYTFKSIPRLLEMIKPTDRAKAYCQKLIDSLLQEGYATDAKIVSNCLKQMNGEKVAMATMDEQKPTDKVEPKFHEGDWIVFNGLTLYVKEVVKGFYRTISKGGIAISYDWKIDNIARLWTIHEAMDGDVLNDGTTIFIFKDLLSDGSVMSYCDYDKNSGESDAFCPLSMNLMCSKITPVTKEQRNLLFQKMKEADYEWDAEKKELKKIGQKFTSFERCLKHIMEETIECGDTHNLKADAEMLLRVAHKHAEWSEEDENHIKSILSTIECCKAQFSNVQAVIEAYNADIDWLKTIKERYTWKPSEEQMSALQRCVEYLDESDNEDYGIIESLCNDLSKL